MIYSEMFVLYHFNSYSPMLSSDYHTIQIDVKKVDKGEMGFEEK